MLGAHRLLYIDPPFSFSFLSQTEKESGSFSNGIPNFIRVFKCLTQAYNLTQQHDLYVFLFFLLFTQKREFGQVHADDVHCTNGDFPMEAIAIPHIDPHWNC